MDIRIRRWPRRLAVHLSAIMLLLLTILVSSCGNDVPGVPTPAPDAPTATAIDTAIATATATTIPVMPGTAQAIWEEVSQNFTTMTDLQFDTYTETLGGKHIVPSHAWVYDVDEDGDLTLNLEPPPSDDKRLRVRYFLPPPEIKAMLARLSKGEEVLVEGALSMKHGGISVAFPPVDVDHASHTLQSLELETETSVPEITSVK